MKHQESKERTTEIYKCTEENCRFEAGKKQYLKNHIASVHIKGKWKCNICDYNSHLKSHVKIHQKSRSHIDKEVTVLRVDYPEGEEKKVSGKTRKNYNEIYKCTVCGGILKSYRTRIAHYKKEHPNDRIFNCMDCKYATNYLPNMKNHTDSIHEKKVRQCPHCSYNSTWQCSLLEHMRNVHGVFQNKSKYRDGQPILCDDCGFSTFNKKQFNSHKLAACHK